MPEGAGELDSQHVSTVEVMKLKEIAEDLAMFSRANPPLIHIYTEGIITFEGALFSACSKHPIFFTQCGLSIRTRSQMKFWSRCA